MKKQVRKHAHKFGFSEGPYERMRCFDYSGAEESNELLGIGHVGSHDGNTLKVERNHFFI